MQSTLEAVADSIASQYASATDNIIDDATHMETKRDSAHAEVARLQEEYCGLNAKILHLARGETG
jgi:hypothetical protein